VQSDLFPDEQSPAFVHEPARSKAKRKIKFRGVEVEVDSVDDSRVNLNTLDTRIYGLQIPITICRSDVRLLHLNDLEAEAWKKKYMPLSCVYTDDDFTDRGKVALLRRRGYAFADVARDFPDLADAAAAAAIEAGAAIG